MIDVFIPYWGVPEQLFSAVESVRSQTSPNWRLTVVDDCYPEDTSWYFKRIDDPRVRYFRNDTNQGIIKNFTRCQEMAQGDYTVIMGCDDMLLPDYVSVIERTAKKLPGVEIIQPGVQVIDGSGQATHPLADRVKDLIRPRSKGVAVVSGEEAARSLLIGDWLYWPSLAFKTSSLKSAEFLPDYQIILDLGIILDLIQMGARVAIVQDVVFAYRRHSESLSSESLLDGPRFADEKSFFNQRAQTLEQMGWHKAARSARLHLTSRAYALTLLPSAVLSKSSVAPLLTHAFR